jgi:hypothetical protein
LDVVGWEVEDLSADGGLESSHFGVIPLERVKSFSVYTWVENIFSREVLKNDEFGDLADLDPGARVQLNQV